MNTLRYILLSAITCALLYSGAYASYYPFILKTVPPVCIRCDHAVEEYHKHLIQTLLNSGIFIGDSSSYTIPEGAYNPPNINELFRTISVSVTSRRIVSYKKLTPYLTEKLENTEYTVTITIASQTNPVEYTIKEENITAQQLEQFFEKAGSDIIAFYSQKQIPVLYQSPGIFSFTGITLSPVHIASSTKLKECAHSGAGFTISSYFTYNQFPRLTIMPSITWFMLQHPVASIKSWHSISLMFNTGYPVQLPWSFSVTPFAGAGYIVHSITGDRYHTYPPYTYSHSFYYNPQVATGIILSLMLDSQLSVSGSAAYTTFFGSSSHWSYFMYTLGFTFHCNIVLYQTKPYH